MEVVLPGFAFLVIVVVLVAAMLMRGNRAKVWQQFAAQHGLRYEASSWLEPPVISGRYGGTAVILTIEYRGSGKSRQSYTRAEAAFTSPAPSSLKIAKEGFGASLAKLFGGQDIQVGLPDPDAVLRIQGRDEVAVQRFMQRGKIGRLVQLFVTSHDEALLTHKGAKVVISGHEKNPYTLQSLIESVSSVVRDIERELRWSPREAGRHVPTPRKPYEPRKERATENEPPDAAEKRVDSGADASPADRMIAELAQDGVKDSTGKFTLDREVAQRKMREFQLKDPATYVLEMVQAAVLKGAERIAFDIDTDDMRMCFDGRHFSAADFDLLYNSLFTTEADPDTRARQRLAIGVNAALGPEPKYIRVVSGDGEQGTRLLLQPGAPDKIVKLTDAEVDRAPGTEIHVKSRLGQRLATGNRDVIEQIEACCRYAHAKITIGEERISGGPNLEGAFGVVEIRGEHLGGHCGFWPSLETASEVRLITDGVWISRYRLQDATPGLLAVVESDRFHKDLSQGEIVRDDAWQRALDAVYEAELRAVDAFSAQLGQLMGQSDFDSKWAFQVLKTRTRSYGSLDDFRAGGGAEGLARAPLWRTMANTAVSLRSLISQLDETGHVDHADYSLRALGLTSTALSHARIDTNRVLLLRWHSDPQDTAFLTHLFGDALRSRSDDLLKLGR